MEVVVAYSGLVGQKVLGEPIFGSGFKPKT